MSNEPEEAAPGSGLACFISQDRHCGPDCMAYLPQAPTGPTYTGQQWGHCLLLVSAEKTSRHLTIIAGEQVKIAGEQTKAAAVAARTASAPKVI